MIVFCIGKIISVPIEHYISIPGSYYSGSVEHSVIENAFPKFEKLPIFIDYNSAQIYRDGKIKKSYDGIILSAPPIFAIRIDPIFIEESKSSVNGNQINQYSILQKHIIDKMYVNFLADHPYNYRSVFAFGNRKKDKYLAAFFKPCSAEPKRLDSKNRKDLNNLIEIYCDGFFRTHKLEAGKLKEKLAQVDSKRIDSSEFDKKILNILVDEFLSLKPKDRDKDYGSMLITAIQYFETGFHYKELVNSTAKEILDTKMNNNVSNLILTYLEQPHSSRVNSI